jgi:excinuclease ABC subunit B
VRKDVADILEGAVAPGAKVKTKRGARKVAEPTADYFDTVAAMTPNEFKKEMKRLEDKMMEHAKNLEFEEAAAVRDQLTKLKDKMFIN